MMEKNNVELKSFDELLKSAEDLLIQRVEERQSTGETDVKKLVHALQVHQIELEMQNDELRRAQIELEESKQKYELLKSEFSRHSPVISASASSTVPGRLFSSLSVNPEGYSQEETKTMYTLKTDYDFLKTLKIFSVY